MRIRGVEAICRAKINLTLDVLDRRPDGYHNLDSIMQSVELADRLNVRQTLEQGIRLSVNWGFIPNGPANTVYRACELFTEAARLDSGISVAIDKRIPVQAGLGGGSSDAAGALLALNNLSGSLLTDAELAGIAYEIGSDVSFFLAGGTARVTGSGETVRKLPDCHELHLVIVKPEIGVSTAGAYARLDAIDGRRSARAADNMERAIRDGRWEGLSMLLSNDFELHICEDYSEIGRLKHEFERCGAVASLLCGSGAAVFGVFDTSEQAQEASRTLGSRYPFAVAVGSASHAITLREVDNVR